MSLKFFHVFFIVVSILFALGFGLWGLREHAAGHDGSHLALGVLSLIVGAALALYLVSFVKKMRSHRFGIALYLACAALAASPALAGACPVCWGDPQSPMRAGLNSGIYVLLGVTAFVLGGFVTLIMTIRRRTQRWEARKQDFHVVNFSEPAHPSRRG
jgi:hypothetical protein